MSDWCPEVGDVVQGIDPAAMPGWRGEVIGVYRVSPENNTLYWADVRWEVGPEETELTRVPLCELEPFIWPGEE